MILLYCKLVILGIVGMHSHTHQKQQYQLKGNFDLYLHEILHSLRYYTYIDNNRIFLHFRLFQRKNARKKKKMLPNFGTFLSMFEQSRIFCYILPLIIFWFVKTIFILKRRFSWKFTSSVNVIKNLHILYINLSVFNKIKYEWQN